VNDVGSVLICELINAFTSDMKPLGAEAIGNPVVVCMGDKFPSESMMSEISAELSTPIICFLDCSHIDESIVEIRYYDTNGVEVNICGHGTLGSIKALDDIYNIKQNSEIRFIPNYKKYQKLCDQTICGSKEQDGYAIRFPRLVKHEIDDESVIRSIAQAIETVPDKIDEVYYASTDDYIVVMNDIAEMRRLEPDYQAILGLPEKVRVVKLRAIMTTCRSDQDNFDFETRVFAPSIGCDEDIACGSANCSVAHMWMEKLEKRDMRMFYPYKVLKDRKVGGVQQLHIVDEDFVKIYSQAILSKSYRIIYDVEKNTYKFER
jgi:PhzF family phenazine biosynthesis protein